MSGRFTDGWLGRIGLVATAPGNATEADFNRYRPEGVAVMTTRTPLTASTPEGIRAMNDHVARAASMLADNAYCGVILLSSTAGSFVEGLDEDRRQCQALSACCGTRVISSAGCMLEALKEVQADSVTLITPSAPALNRLEVEFLGQAGITVAAQGGFQLSSPRDILCISPQEVCQLIRLRDVPQAQAVLISCSGLHVMEVIPQLEAELGKPVLASNQFGLWGCLRALGVKAERPELGQLFCGRE